MKALLLRDILKVIGNFDLSNIDDIKICNVVKDPDYLKSNTLLFHRKKAEPLPWDNFKNYHSYVLVIEDRGIDTLEIKDNYIIVKVMDIEKAYLSFVKYYRNLFNIDIYGVTGTCGKTTTKEMLKHIFSADHEVQATINSRNSSRLNLSYLLGIDDKTEVAVFELGVYYYPGDILDSCQYFSPTVGIITNIGVDHLNRCGTVENYIKAKAELLEGMSFKGTLILNGDDENIKKIDLTSFKGRIIYFGKSSSAEFMAESIVYEKDGMKFILKHDNKTYDVYVPGYGEHNVYNALAAIAGAYVKGISIEEAAKRLKSFNHIRSHLQRFEGINGCTVLDDTWSSNPLSVERALEVLKTIGVNKKKIAILGHMTLLGESTQSEHERIGKLIVEKGIDFLILRGELAKIIGSSALDCGMNSNNVFFCKDSIEVLKAFKSIADKNSLVLVKTDMFDKSMDLLEEIIVKN